MDEDHEPRKPHAKLVACLIFAMFSVPLAAIILGPYLWAIMYALFGKPPAH